MTHWRRAIPTHSLRTGARTRASRRETVGSHRRRLEASRREATVGSWRGARRAAGCTHGRGRGWRVVGHNKTGRHGRDGDLDVVLLRLRSERALRSVTVTLALAVLLESVLDRDLLVHEELAVHVLDRIVGGFERGVGDESIALADVGVVARDLGRSDQRAEAREGLEEHLLLHHGVQVSNEQLSSNSCATAQSRSFSSSSTLVCARLVDANRLAPEANLIHDLDGVVGIFLGRKLDEAIALVSLGDAVFREVNVDDGSGLYHQFPDNRIGCLLGEIADVDRAVLVLFPVGGQRITFGLHFGDGFVTVPMLCA